MQTSTIKVTANARMFCVLLIIASALSSSAQTDIWTQKSDVGSNTIQFSPRVGPLGFSIGNKGYYGTGLNVIYMLDFWEYDPDTNTWTQKADFAGPARRSAVGFSIGSKGYVGTGINEDTYYKDFWEYDPALNKWTQKSNFGGNGRENAVGFGIGDKGYVGTGYNEDGPVFYFKDFWEYDSASDSWMQKSSFGGNARVYSVGFSIGSMGYLGTGFYNTALYKDFWEYDPANDSWIQKADFGGGIRYNAAGFAIDSKGYLGTGTNGVNYKDFWEYDPAVNTWIKMADAGENVNGGAVGFSIGSKGYLVASNSWATKGTEFLEFDPAINTWILKDFLSGIGRKNAVGFSIGSKGYIGTGKNVETYFKDLWEYDPLTNSWTQRADFGGGDRENAVGFNVGNKGYIGTGYSYDGAPAYYQDFWEYDPFTNFWTKKQDFPGTPRHEAVGFSIGDKGYLGTGQNTGAEKDFWEYDPAIDNWKKRKGFEGDARYSAVGFSIGLKGYIATGTKSNDLYTDFWEYDPENNAWTEKAYLPPYNYKREGAVGFSIGNKGYVGTGITAYGNQPDFLEYDPDLNTWTQKKNFGGTGRGYAVGFSIGSKGYIGTGEDIHYERNDFWEYNPDSCFSYMAFADLDGDSFGNPAESILITDCILPAGYVTNSTDCIDTNAALNPLAIEICDSLDNNCNGLIDEGVMLISYTDADGDSFGDYNSIISCVIPAGNVTNNTDCDDNNAAVNPSAIEVCDIIDNNCNGSIDENLILIFYEDLDNDGFGNSNSSVDSCALPVGYTSDSTDCDDSNASVFPGAIEVAFNNIDDDCDGDIDEFGIGISEVNSISFFNIFPNPADNQTTVQFSLAHSSQVNISVYDLSGKKVIVIINDQLKKGNHSYQINTVSFLKGIYIVTMKSEEEIQNRKLVVQ